MAVLQNAGRIALASAMAAQPIHMAWGHGDPAWDAAPVATPTNATALIAEVARRTCTSVGYCLPSATGEIEQPDGTKYTASSVPTQWLYIRFTFDFSDAQGQVLREFGIFMGTQVVPGLPAGQRYFTPAQVANPGQLYALDRLPQFTRNGAVRQVFEYVLPF